MMQARKNIDHRFAWLFEANDAPRPCPWDSVLCRDDEGTSVPSRGSIVPGWLLSFPSAPAINLASLTAQARDRLLRHANAVAANVAPMAARLFQFEHGAALAGSLTGCGLDVAHLHSVPLNFDLIDECRSQLADYVEWAADVNADDPWMSFIGAEYVIIREVGSDRMIAGRPRAPTSQLVRRVIARATGKSDRWDYRADDGAENVAQTLRAFARDPF